MQESAAAARLVHSQASCRKLSKTRRRLRAATRSLKIAAHQEQGLLAGLHSSQREARQELADLLQERGQLATSTQVGASWLHGKA